MRSRFWGYQPHYRRTVGTRITRNARKAPSSGRSADRTEPAQEGTNLSGVGNVDGEEGTQFICGFPSWGMGFRRKTGRGVHEQRMHKNWYDEQQAIKGKAIKKARWTEEGKEMMARKEAELSIKKEQTGSKVNMSQKLLKVFSDRTLESIKGHRRRNSHKARVLRFMDMLRAQQQQLQNSSESSEYVSADEDHEPALNSTWIEYLASLSPMNSTELNADKIDKLCQSLTTMTKKDIVTELGLYLLETFPKSRHEQPPLRQDTYKINGPMSKKKARRAEYARVQDLWKRDPSKCVKRIIDEQLEHEEGVPQERMAPYWKAVMSRNTGFAPNLSPVPGESQEDLWDPIISLEIKLAFPPSKTAVGPDGVNAKTLRKVLLALLAWIFNIIMYAGRAPEHLNISRTVLIPKKKGACEPGDFRPITVSSVVLRTFHKILANRVKKIKIDPRQRGFIETDGCVDNTVLLNLVLKFHRENSKSLFLASLDIRKAFDSVSFEALEEVMKIKKLPNAMVEYIMRGYEANKTILQHAGWESEGIHHACGVKQGDPLSSYLFNFIMDEMIKHIPNEIGVNLGGVRVNILAFADDLILVAQTKTGLQKLTDKVAEFLYHCGLEANSNKCSSIAIRSLAKGKKTYVDKKCTFSIRGQEMPSLKRTDDWV